MWCTARVFIDWVITQIVVVSVAFLPVFELLNFMTLQLFYWRTDMQKSYGVKLSYLSFSNEGFSVSYGWLPRMSNLFVKLQVSGRYFLLMPQNIAMLFWYDMKSLGKLAEYQWNPLRFSYTIVCQLRFKRSKNGQNENNWKWKIAI